MCILYLSKKLPDFLSLLTDVKRVLREREREREKERGRESEREKKREKEREKKTLIIVKLQ